MQGRTYPRRRLLTFAAGISLGSLAGCGDTSQAGPGPTRPSTSAPSPDVALVDEVLADERRLLALVEQTARVQPATTDRLRVPRAIVVAHVRWLESVRVDGRRAAEPPVVVVPRGRRAAVVAVANAYRSAASARRRQCVRARAGSLAQMLASMSAAHGVLVVELTNR